MRIHQAACIVVLSCITVGCSSASQRALAELDTVEKAGGNGDAICAAHRKVAQAFLHESNAERYREEQAIADVSCDRAASDRDYGEGTEGITADNLDAF